MVGRREEMSLKRLTFFASRCWKNFFMTSSAEVMNEPMKLIGWLRALAHVFDQSTPTNA